MYLKFNENESIYSCDYYDDKITSTLNFTIKEIEDFSELLNIFKNNTVDVYLYHDSECTLLEGQYRTYIILSLNIEYNTKTLSLSLKPSDIAEELTTLKESLDKTQTSVIEVSRQVKNIDEQINPTPINPSLLSLEDSRTYQLETVNKECTEAIYAGIDVETSIGTEHFSLTEADQLNITALQTKCMSGVKSVPYHSSGQICREFTAEEIIHIADKAMEHVVYCTTLCNHIRAWINRTDEVEEVITIHFTSALPDDLQESFDRIINISSGESQEQI